MHIHPNPVEQDRCMGRRTGPVRGNAQRGKNVISYVVGSGAPYRVGCNIPPSAAEKIVTAARGTNGSVAGLIVALIERMEVDENGLPVWYEPPNEQQEQLIA